MKERPILFSGDMVRALLEGRKTMTRRAVKLNHAGRVQHGGKNWHLDDPDAVMACPYGRPGDRLWVREAFSGPHCMEAGEGCATVPPSKWGMSSRIWYWADGDPSDGDWTRPRPSIHMPRWASRITLEIVSVRVERLKEISEEDAKAEGAFFTDYGRRCFHQGAPRDVGQCPAPDDHHPQRDGWSMAPTESHEQCLSSARTAFANLWERISGPASWDANPWVWVVEFKRVE